MALPAVTGLTPFLQGCSVRDSSFQPHPAPMEAVPEFSLEPAPDLEATLAARELIVRHAQKRRHDDLKVSTTAPAAPDLRPLVEPSIRPSSLPTKKTALPNAQGRPERPVVVEQPDPLVADPTVLSFMATLVPSEAT